MHFDFHLRAHFESAMRDFEFHARDEIAERIHFIAPPARAWRELDGVLQAFLVTRGSRNQMQQLVRVHDVAAVRVHGVVANVVLHVASAWASAP